ncbi:MAG: hypothetical protein H0T45_08395, partial [Pyrinomonadaceae bacterium]|nr:hypothetical protein [Pyrinomonadaceae bacterium]
TIWREPERARDLGRQGAAAVRARYSVAHMADCALEVYEEVISEQQPVQTKTSEHGFAIADY